MGCDGAVLKNEKRQQADLLPLIVEKASNIACAGTGLKHQNATKRRGAPGTHHWLFGGCKNHQ